MKQTEPIKKPTQHILNGREAEVADPDYNSADDDEDEGGHQGTQHKFSQPDHMKLLLESKLSLQDGTQFSSSDCNCHFHILVKQIQG